MSSPGSVSCGQRAGGYSSKMAPRVHPDDVGKSSQGRGHMGWDELSSSNFISQSQIILENSLPFFTNIL